jgi:hypothetical protein
MIMIKTAKIKKIRMPDNICLVSNDLRLLLI